MLTRQEAEEIWNMAKDPDAYPKYNEDEINDYYETMAEELVTAFVAGELFYLKERDDDD